VITISGLDAFGLHTIYVYVRIYVVRERDIITFINWTSNISVYTGNEILIKERKTAPSK